MRKSFLLVGYLAFLGVAHAGSVDDLDRANGLPGAKLGATLDSFRGLTLVEDTGRWLTYKPPGEKFSYAGFEVTRIRYNFFKGRLYSINVDIDGKRSTRGILKSLETDFGTAHSLEKHRLPGADTDLEVREWTGRKDYLLYKSAANDAGAQITFLDKPTWDQLQIPREQRKQQYRQMLDGSFSNGDF